MKAEQYRALVSKLEAIQQLNEAPEDDAPEHNEPPLKIGDVDPRNGQKILSALTSSDGTVVRNRYGDIWNVKYGPADAPAPPPVQEPVVDITPRPPIQLPDVEPEPTPTPAPAEVKCGPEVQEKIKAQKTFNAAYAMAKQSGCPEFDWCQIVNVQTPAPMPSATNPTPTNPMGDFDPTAFSGNQVREGDEELDRIREIAGTQIVAEAGEIPEIKASSKEAAIAIAQKKGIKQFRFCGHYKVQAAKRQNPAPKPQGDAWHAALGKGSENSANLAKPDPTAAAFGNPNITNQGRKAGATRLPGQGT